MFDISNTKLIVSVALGMTVDYQCYTWHLPVTDELLPIGHACNKVTALIQGRSGLSYVYPTIAVHTDHALVRSILVH